MKHTRNIKPSQPYLHWSIALLFLFLTACGGGTTPDLGNQEGVEVSILSSLGSSFGTSDLGASEVTTQGVPSNPETGQTGVATAELEVYSGDTRLFFNEGEIVDEAQGQAVTLTPEDSDVSLSLPPGTYTFSLTAFDEREPANVLAKGEVEQQIGEDSRVSVPLTSLLGSARFEAPESVKGNEVFDALLSVSPPGREDLKVPLGDYTTAYEVEEPSVQLEGASNIGVRMAAACDAVEVTATISNDLSDALGASVSVPIDDEACAGSGNDVGTDLVSPFVSFSDLEDGDTLPLSFTLTGVANDMQSGMDKVEVYEGTAKLGEAELGSGDRLTPWRFDYATEREGSFTFIAVAFDKAGNSRRAEVEVTVNKDDTSTQEVEIPDEVLEATIRDELNKPQGTLTQKNLASLTKLGIEEPTYYGPEEAVAVENLEGLQFALNLERLDIPVDTEDLSPLAELSKLTFLELSRFGDIEGRTVDLSPISTLTNLKTFGLTYNHVSDLSALANLSNLENLLLSDNEISDLTPLQNLSKLEFLLLNRNQLENLSGLESLSALERLDLSDNQISDIAPLVQNEGLGEGDELDLGRNGLEACPGTGSRADIDTLIERGVDVDFNEPENCDGEGGDNQVVQIPDAKLESLIREALNKPEGDLTKQDLEQVEVIDFDGLNRRNVVRNLEGLEFATNLKKLSLPFNGVGNLDPLLDNSSFGEGDSLNLLFNPLDTCPGTEDRNALDTLTERGVQVAFDDPEDCGAAGPITVTSTSAAASLEDECTLRAAITAANTDQAVGGCSAGDGEDTIALDDRATYTLNETDNEREDEDGFPFANGLPIITSIIKIEGNGATIERQRGSPAFRLFEVAEGGNLDLESATLQGGSGSPGGGIYNAGRASVSLSIIRANDVTDLPGGGIYNTGNFSLSDSDVVENAGVDGAGVYNTGDFSAFESAIDNNRGVNSGGLYNTGDMTLEQSSISSNVTDDSRGAVLNTETGVFTARSARISGNGDDGITFDNRGEAHFESVVYSGNSRELWNGGTMTVTKSAIVQSGGIENFGTLSVTNSTLSNLGRTLRNVDASVLNRDGGTLFLSYATVAGNERSLINESGTLTLTSSIVADNAEDENEQPNCVGSVTSEGYNIDSDGSCNFNQATDLSNMDPQLGPLQDNGGSTPTQALQESSPAVDAVPTDVCTVGTDQRVKRRPQGEACDIGAFERGQ